MEFQTTNKPHRKAFVIATLSLLSFEFAILTFQYLLTPADYDSGRISDYGRKTYFTITEYVSFSIILLLACAFPVLLKRILLNIRFDGDNTVRIKYIEQLKFRPKTIVMDRKDLKPYLDIWPSTDLWQADTWSSLSVKTKYVKFYTKEFGTFSVSERELESFNKLLEFLKLG